LENSLLFSLSKIMDIHKNWSYAEVSFYKDGEHKNSFRIGFPSVAGSKINAGLKQIAEAAKLFLA
jgi:DNA-binding transcriptional MocR family regulator